MTGEAHDTSPVASCESVNTILAFAYIKSVAVSPSTSLEVATMGEPRAAVVLDEPAYDPENLRPRKDQ